MAARAKHVKSIRQLAALAGVSDTTWKKHVAEGCPTPKHARDIQPWLVRYHTWRTKHGKFRTEASAPAIDTETATATRETAKTRLALMRVELEKRTGELISRRAVIEYCGRAVLAVRLRLDATRKKMAARLQHSDSATIDEELGREFDAICDDFARGMGRAHDQNATDGSEDARQRAGDSAQLGSAEDDDGKRVGRRAPRARSTRRR